MAVFYDMFIKGEVIKRVDSCKYLGITIDDKLICKAHVDIIIEKMCSHLYCLKKLRSFNVHP